MNNFENKYKWYLLDLGDSIKRNALETKQYYDNCKQEEEKILLKGMIIIYYKVIKIMIKQAKKFKISLEEIRLNDIDPDKDLQI